MKMEANEEGPSGGGAKLRVQMGSRLLPLSLVLGAAFADLAGAHQPAGLVLLIAIPCAAGAAFVAVSDLLEGRPAVVRTFTTVGALVCCLVASAVRHGAPAGAAVPALALSAVVAACVLYAVPVLLWVLQPVSLRPAPHGVRGAVTGL
jgi:hypothetical protein